MSIDRALKAVAAIFFVSGFIVGSWAAYIPILKERLGLSETVLGFALLVAALTAFLAMPLVGGLIARIGSGPISKWFALGASLTLPVPALAENIWVLVIGLALFGFCHGGLDVAMNAHAALVETKRGKPVMSFFHGMFSLGCLCGAGLAIPALSMLSEVTHVALATAAMALLAVAAVFSLFPGSADQGLQSEGFRWPRGALFLVGLLAFLAYLSEGALLDWAGIYLAETLAAPSTLAASGFAAFSATMTIGRFSGDALRRRFGAPRLLLFGGVMVIIGLGTTLTAAHLTLALIGLAIAGLGMANLAPILFLAGSWSTPHAPGQGIAAVASLGYLGLLAGPPVIGFIADASSLGFALTLVALSGAAFIFGAPLVRAKG